MSNYDPVECLREEVHRFKDTNRFSPMTVTNFFVQAGLVISELDRVRADHATLIAENSRLKGEVEQLSDVLKTSQLVANLKSFEKCAADLQRHKDALKEAKVAFDAFVSWADELNKMVGHKPDVESYRAVEKSLATINKVLGETEGE